MYSPRLTIAKQIYSYLSMKFISSLAYNTKESMLGNGQNTADPVPAKTILSIMINPSFGAPAFVARLLAVLCLYADFLFKIVKSDEAGGRVYIVLRVIIFQLTKRN